MATLSPQRSRRPQPQQINSGPMLNREPSPSPSLRDRPRAVKGQSMPLIPTNALFAVQQGSQNQQQQSSPTIPSTGARRSPPPGQISRLLPTPPQPNSSNFTEDRRMSPPPGSQQVHGSYRPSPRGPIPYAAMLESMDELAITPQLLADIERADQQYQALLPNHGYTPYNTGPRGESPSSGKAQNNIDRIRGPPSGGAINGASPDQSQQRSWPTQPQRESPKVRDRASLGNGSSPLIPGSGPSHTPERRMSPVQHTTHTISGDPHPSSYLAQYNNREAASMRRAPPSNDSRLNLSMASQTPPLQNIPTRTPDRSLPVQEEDEVTAKNNGSAWQINDQSTEQHHHSSSPTPSSDLNPEVGNQRFDNVGISHANLPDEDQVPPKHENNHVQYTKRESSTDEDGSYTPRSPTSGLPEGDSFYPNQGHAAGNTALPAPRPKVRTGSLNQIMLELESSMPESSVPDTPPPQPTDRTGQFSAEMRQHGANGSGQYQHYSPRDMNDFNHRSNGNDYVNGNDGQYQPPRVYPDDFHSHGEDSAAHAHFFQSILRQYMSPRPDAPIPPTPHSQTAAPSPSPLLSDYNIGREMLAHRALRASGSPYPFPYNHVRRNRPPPAPTSSRAVLDEYVTGQIARQWQVYAQNMGQMTDSTLSPSSTPFQGEMFEPWAEMHQKRMIARLRNNNPDLRPLDTASIQSSPSHQPIPLPLPPVLAAAAKKNGAQPKRRSFGRKPPPRVESTQPRETTPEPTSSGEETSVAGEERSHSAPVGRVTAPPTNSAAHDPEDEWIDEDEDDDYEDLIELEYHPTYVRNSSKRRRKWEVGWETLIQAFQALDRQTDATMILMASPSHSNKLHVLRSRSIRRHSHIEKSMAMHQMRYGFSNVANQRRALIQKPSLVSDFHVSSRSSGNGSDGSSTSVEENLRRTLDMALESLGLMGKVSEQRELRMLEELQRSREDRDRVELLLKTVLGDKNNPLSSQKPRSAS